MSDKITEGNDLTTCQPLVFISHDARDAKLAEEFSNLLKNVSAGVLKSFRSSDKKVNQGIEYGVEWYPVIIKNIQTASDVVCLLTENSINRPWILFEAGMAKGKLDTPILGVALGIQLTQASTGPFAQFQNCSDDEDSLTKLVFQLVNRIPNSEPDEETIKSQVTKFKKNINQLIETKKKSKPETENDNIQETDNTSAKLFEEIKMMFQDLPARIDRNMQVDYRERKRRLSPLMIEELVHLHKNRYAGIMIALSIFKETMPWIYEIGMETMKTIRNSKSEEEKIKAFSDFKDIIYLSNNNPVFRKMSVDSKEDYMMKEMTMVLLDSFSRFLNNKNV